MAAVGAVNPQVRAGTGSTPARTVGARGAKSVPPAAAPPPSRRRGITPLTPMRVQAAKSMSRLADSVKDSHPDLPAGQHLMDAARTLRQGNEEASQRHLRAAMFSLTPQSLMRNGIHIDDLHIGARAVLHGVHRHLLLVKDIQDVAAKNQRAIARDSYGDLESAPTPPDPNAGYGPGALAAKPTARQPGGDRALNAPDKTSAGRPDPNVADPNVADPVGRQPKGSRQFAGTWGELAHVIDLVGPHGYIHGWIKPGASAQVTKGYHAGKKGHIVALDEGDSGNAVIEQPDGSRFTTGKHVLAPGGEPDKAVEQKPAAPPPLKHSDLKQGMRIKTPMGEGVIARVSRGPHGIPGADVQLGPSTNREGYGAHFVPLTSLQRPAAAPQPKGSKQFATWDEVCTVLEMAPPEVTAYDWDDVVAVIGVIDLSAQTARLAVTPAPYGKPGGPGLYDVKGLRHSAYFEQIVKALMEKRGMDKGRASAIAYGALRKWSRGGGKVHPEVRAAAGGALAEEKAKGAAAKAVHGHANTWDEVDAVVELAAAQTRVPAGQPGAGQWAAAQQQQAVAGHQAGATAAQLHMAHIAHLRHLVATGKATPAQTTQLAALMKTLGTAVKAKPAAKAPAKAAAKPKAAAAPKAAKAPAAPKAAKAAPKAAKAPAAPKAAKAPAVKKAAAPKKATAAAKAPASTTQPASPAASSTASPSGTTSSAAPGTASSGTSSGTSSSGTPSSTTAGTTAAATTPPATGTTGTAATGTPAAATGTPTATPAATAPATAATPPAASSSAATAPAATSAAAAATAPATAPGTTATAAQAPATPATPAAAIKAAQAAPPASGRPVAAPMSAAPVFNKNGSVTATVGGKKMTMTAQRWQKLRRAQLQAAGPNAR
jgi:hypothetical protein